MGAHLTIDDCMSPCPYTIGRSEPLAAAHELMRRHNIRHLPVLDNSELVGVVSLRDLHLMETLRDIDPEAVGVGEAMSETPYAVPIGTPLKTVALQMHARKLGSAVVMDGARVVGMFTTIDALRALANLLSSEP
jgi:acetoin utilization protein AcuB